MDTGFFTTVNGYTYFVGIKSRCISECIVQAARPRSIIAPILFGVGVSLEKSCGSKFLIKVLSKLGFSISPEEVVRFKQSAITRDKEKQLEAERLDPHSFM
jgi:hypothetical protein